MSQSSNDQNHLRPGPLAAVHGVEAPQTAAGRTSSEPCQISMFCRVRKRDKNIQNITKRKVLTFYRLSCQRVNARSCLSMAINDWVFNDVWRIIAQDVSRAVNLAAWPRMFGVHQFIISRMVLLALGGHPHQNGSWSNECSVVQTGFARKKSRTL